MSDQSWVSPRLACGLGNRLFQFAAAAGAAERWGRHLVFYLPACSNAEHGNMATLFRMFPSVPLLIESTAVPTPTTEVSEPVGGYYRFTPLPATPPATPVIVSGFRQSPQYFPKDLSRLTPNWDVALGSPAIRALLEREVELDTPAARATTVAVHARFGDYCLLPQYQISLGLYYAQALQRIPKGSIILLFSDEPERCERVFQELVAKLGLQLRIAPVRAAEETLYQMSLCLGGTIVGNSTFGWWGAWFAHQNGAPWATFPLRWQKEHPPPFSLFPAWATVLPTSEEEAELLAT